LIIDNKLFKFRNIQSVIRFHNIYNIMSDLERSVLAKEMNDFTKKLKIK